MRTATIAIHLASENCHLWL